MCPPPDPLLNMRTCFTSFFEGCSLPPCRPSSFSARSLTFMPSLILAGFSYRSLRARLLSLGDISFSSGMLRLSSPARTPDGNPPMISSYFHDFVGAALPLELRTRFLLGISLSTFIGAQASTFLLIGVSRVTLTTCPHVAPPACFSRRLF